MGHFECIFRVKYINTRIIQMGKIRKNQEGFSVVEVVLVLVVVALIGVVGFMVYKNQHKTTNNSTTNATTLTTPPKTTTPPVTTPAQTTDTLTVKEWGVKVPLTTDISDLTYEVTGKGLNLHDQNQPVIKFYTKRLKEAQGICSSNNFPVSLNRGISTDIPIMGDGPGPDDTTANTYGYLYDHKSITPDGGRIHVGLIKVGTYYYTDALYPGAACSNYNDPTAEKARNTEPLDSIVKAVKAMQPL